MATETIKVNAIASLTANGTSTTTGSISWTEPSLPSDVTSWDNVRVSGTWSWGGKGTITRVTINGTNTSTGIAFDIELPKTITSPLSITCVGNKNATGSSFSWNNLTINYTYTTANNEQFMIKMNGTWQNVSKIYKKINGQWIEQTELNSLFDSNEKYFNANK